MQAITSLKKLKGTKMYDSLILLILFAGFGSLIFGYLTQERYMKYAFMITGAFLIITFGGIATSDLGLREENGASFHVVRDGSSQIQDVNMVIDYVSVNASNRIGLKVLGDTFYWLGFVLVLIIFADWSFWLVKRDRSGR